MLRDKSQELPSSLQPQWLLNRSAAAAAGSDAAGSGAPKQSPAAPSAAPAAGREGKWVADRWGATEKDPDSKWGHDPYDRPRWGEERPDGDERGLGSGRMPRDTGRWKGGEWGNTAQPAFPPAERERGGADRWDRDRAERAELLPVREPVRDPAARSRWRPDDKQEKWGRGDTGVTWRALPGEGGTGFRPGGRGGGLDRDDRFGDRPERGGVGIPGRDERDFGTSRLIDERLPGKGRGFVGYGRGRPAGSPAAPGAGSYERLDRGDWGGRAERDLDGGGGLTRTYSGHASRGRTKIKEYTHGHLEDLMSLMEIKVNGDLPLPRGLTTEELGEIWKGYVYANDHCIDRRSSIDATAAAAADPTAAAAAGARSSMEGAAPSAAGRSSFEAAAPPAAAAAAAAEAPAVPAPAAAAAGPPPLPAHVMQLLPSGMSPQALEHDQWVYKDPSGNQQGPFSRTDILDWAEHGFFSDTLPICSALPGQEAVWTTLHHMVLVWAQMAGGQAPPAAEEQQQQQQPLPDFGGLGASQRGPEQSRMRVEAWLQQQPDQQAQQQQQQQHEAAAAAAAAQQQQHPHPGFPYGPPVPHTFGGGPGHAMLGPGDSAASGAFPATPPLFPPAPVQSFAPGGPVSGGAPGAAATGAPHMGHPMGGYEAAQQQQQQQQRTLFGTPLEPSPAPAAAAAAAAAAPGAPLTTTGSKMLDMLFKRGVHAAAPQQQQQAPAAVEAPSAAAAAAAAAAAPLHQDSGNWETVPTKASKQQERAAAQQVRQQQHEQQQWQQQQQRQPSSAMEDEDTAVVPSGPVQVPLFPQQQKPEPPKVAPWAAAAPAAAAAAPGRPKSLREIQEEEQARAAAEAARAEAAAAAAAAAGPAAAPAAAGPGPAWGGAAARPGGSSGVPPGWGPPPMAAMGGQPPLGRAGSDAAAGPVGADEQPAPAKKATLGDVLKARLGGAGAQRTGSNASSTSLGQQQQAGPWGPAAVGARQPVPLAQIIQQEHEETIADMEGGGLQEENIEEVIARLSRHNSSRQQQQQQHAAAAHNDGLFWDYSGAAGGAAAPEPPAQQQQQQANVWATPPAAVAAAQAAAAAARNAGAPSAAAPPPVAGPWARAAQHNVIKAPPPGSFNPAAAAAAARPAAAAAAARPAAQAPAAARAPTAAAKAPAAAAAVGNGPAAMAAGGSNGTAAAGGGGLFEGGLDISAAFAAWCRAQMLSLNGNEDLTMIEFLWGLDSNSEIAEYCQMVWGNKPGVSSFVAEFVKRKLAEKNRKPGGKKKKGGAAAAAAGGCGMAAPIGVSAAAVGLVNAGPATDAWNKIPKKPGAKGKKGKGTKLDVGALGFTTANHLNVLAEDSD